jgi:hypothetical protein
MSHVVGVIYVVLCIEDLLTINLDKIIAFALSKVILCWVFLCSVWFYLHRWCRAVYWFSVVRYLSIDLLSGAESLRSHPVFS